MRCSQLCDPPARDDEHEPSWAPQPILQFALPLHGPAEIAGIPIADSLLEQMRANVSIEPVSSTTTAAVVGIGRAHAVPVTEAAPGGVVARRVGVGSPAVVGGAGCRSTTSCPAAGGGTDEIVEPGACVPGTPSSA